MLLLGAVLLEVELSLSCGVMLLLCVVLLLDAVLVELRGKQLPLGDPHREAAVSLQALQSLLGS